MINLLFISLLLFILLIIFGSIHLVLKHKNRFSHFIYCTIEILFIACFLSWFLFLFCIFC